MLRAYKYRITPTIAQSTLLNKHLGACRFLYNLALETRNNAYATHRKTLNYNTLAHQLTDLKKDVAWPTLVGALNHEYNKSIGD